MIMFVALIVQLQFHPFTEPHLNRLEAQCLLTIVVTQALLLGYRHSFSKATACWNVTSADQINETGVTENDRFGFHFSTCENGTDQLTESAGEYIGYILILINLDTVVFIFMFAFNRAKGGFWEFGKQAGALATGPRTPS